MFLSFFFPVLPVFLKEATKRNSSGHPVHHSHRDSPGNSGGLCTSTLWSFLSQLREPTMIYLALSLLARIHNVLKDDMKFDINVDYIDSSKGYQNQSLVNLWPASISRYDEFASSLTSSK